MQEFYAVQCFQCKQFQVVQKRKDRKFNCKLCGNKQSVRKVVARSTKAADVRKFVQQLNLRRGQAAEQYDDIHGGSTMANDQKHFQNTDEGAEKFNDIPTASNNSRHTTQCHRPPSPEVLRASKWTQYNSVLMKTNSEFAGPADDTSAECREHLELEGDEHGFVTALPDITALRGKKRKRHGRVRIPSNSRIGSDSARPPDSQQPRSLRGAILPDAQPFQASKRSRTETRTERIGVGSAERHASSKWSSWDNGDTYDSCEKLGDGIGGGLLTSLGSDEVVQEEVLF